MVQPWIRLTVYNSKSTLSTEYVPNIRPEEWAVVEVRILRIANDRP